MSIHFVSGKPGAGKSFYGVKLAFEELRFGDRHIVTNLPLLVGRLNEYYHQHYADDSGLKKYQIPWFVPRWLAGPLFWYLPEAFALRVFPVSPEAAEKRILKPRRDDICGRVHLITDEEMSVFFTKRPEAEIAHVANDQWKRGVRPDYSVVKDSGVMFILDEVHIAFNSRAWAETGAEVLYYLSQHRKLGDDVICITQSVGNVDKQFRSVAQDFTYIRNLAKETFGHFRLPARFIRKTYSQPPTGDNSEPMEMGSFTLDINGLAKCYDTAKGVGIHGRAGADKNARKKGIHWMWFAVGLPIVCWIVFHYAPLLIVKFTGHTFNPPPKKATTDKGSHNAGVMRTNSQQIPDPTDSPAPPENQPNQNLTPRSHSENQTTNEIFCVGWCNVPGDFLVFLSDGTDYSLSDGEVQGVSKRIVKILGKTYKVKRREAYTDAAQIPPLQYDDTSSFPRPINQASVTYIGGPRQRQSPSGHQNFSQSNLRSTSQVSPPSGE